MKETQNYKNTNVLKENTVLAADTSSLILLAKASMLDKTIKNLKKKLTITEEIQKETTKKDTFDSRLINKRIEENKIKKEKIKKTTAKELQKDFNLGEGEAEAITLATEKQTGILTDDKKAINAAKILNIKFTTAPNILTQLKQKGKMTKKEAKTHWNKLKKYGRYSQKIIEEVEKDLK